MLTVWVGLTESRRLFRVRAPPAVWPGPSPRPQRHANPMPAGGQSPRPAPAPPPAGASRPPGRALACRVPGPAGLQGNVARGRGNAVRFLFPPGGAAELRRCHGGGHRPGHHATLTPCPPRRARRWPALRLHQGSLWGLGPYRAGKRGAFLDPPGMESRLSAGSGQFSRPASGGDAVSAPC